MISQIEKAEAALRASGYDACRHDTEGFTISVQDDGDDDEAAQDTLAEIREIVAEFGCDAEWTGNGNTESDGYTTSDICITISE